MSRAALEDKVTMVVLGVMLALVAVPGCAGRTGLASAEVLARPPDARFQKVLVLGMDRRGNLREQT